MYLDAAQKSAISILDSVVTPDNAQASGDDIARMQFMAKNPSNIAGFKASDGDVQNAALGALPKVITPEFIEHLKTLDAYSKAGKEATSEQEEAAVAAYKAIGKHVKTALAKEVIREGIKSYLKDKPTLAPLAPTIADIASGPLAEIAAKASEYHQELIYKLINKALRTMGKEPIETKNADLFMTKLVSRFAGGMLDTLKKKESLTQNRLAATASGDIHVNASQIGAVEMQENRRQQPASQTQL